MTPRTEVATLSWVHGTIFGEPVVPPVNMINASSGRNPSGPAVAGASSAVVSRWAAVSPPTVTETGHDGRAVFGLAGCVGVGVDQDDSRARDRDSGVLLGDGQGRIQRNEDESGARGRQQSDDEFGAAAGS